MKTLRTALLAACLMLVTAAHAGASPAVALEPGPLRATTYELSVRPEFDTPDVLVVNNATLTNTSDMPYQGRIGFRVPRGAQLQMVCEIGQGGGHSCQPFKSEDKGDYVEVWWNGTRPILKGDRFPIFVEYYYNPFTSKNPKKFTHRFYPVYPMDTLYVILTQPKGSSDWQVNPQASLSRPVQDGTVDWQYSYANQPAQLLQFKVSYNKPDDTPSVPRPKPGQPGGAPGGPGGPGGAAQTSQLAPWVVPVMGLLLVAVIACFVLIMRGASARHDE